MVVLGSGPIGTLHIKLENQKLLEGKARITLVPRGGELLPQLLAASTRRQAPDVP